jgi:hypothetical protein
MAQSTISKVDELEKVYRLADADKVKAYLGDHPEMIDLLLEARPHIESQFGPGAIVELRLPRNEDGDFNGQLLAMIQSGLEADPALDSFDRLWDRWWGNASGRPAAWPLYIGVEYARELAL